jgi:TRAP-type transport system periplasmic protein
VYPVGFATTLPLQEVAPHASYLFPYLLHPLNLIGAKSALEELPENLRAIIDEAAATVQEETIAVYLEGEYDQEAMGEWTSKGGKLIEPFPEEDQQAFIEAAEASSGSSSRLAC